MIKKLVQRGRSERGGEAYVACYVEPLSDARTKLAGFFIILQRKRLMRNTRRISRLSAPNNVGRFSGALSTRNPECS